jgi:hypothetical protein
MPDAGGRVGGFDVRERLEEPPVEVAHPGEALAELLVQRIRSAEDTLDDVTSPDRSDVGLEFDDRHSDGMRGLAKLQRGDVIVLAGRLDVLFANLDQVREPVAMPFRVEHLVLRVEDGACSGSSWLSSAMSSRTPDH